MELKLNFNGIHDEYVIKLREIEKRTNGNHIRFDHKTDPIPLRDRVADRPGRCEKG